MARITHLNNHAIDTRKLRKLTLSMMMLCTCLYAAPELNAQGRYIGASIKEIGATESVSVPLYKSRIIEVSSPVKKVSVGNPDIADILVLRDREVYIVGKSLGTTNVVLWDKSNRIVSTVDIEITHDVDTLKMNLHRLLPNEDIKVYSSQGTIVLSGEISSPASMNAALSLATSYAPTDEEGNVEEGKVVNLMHVGGVQQVMLEVKVAEINRTVMNKLDINFHSIYSGQDIKIGGVNGGAGFPNALDKDGLLTPIFGNLLPSDGIIGPVLDQFEPVGPSISDKGLFSTIKRGNYFFNLTIDALKRNGLAKVLAEPNLTTLTGQPATFLAGGEFPIPVPQDNGNTTIEFKEFGIGMDFLPIVLDSDRINLSIGIRVDELTDASSVVLGVAGNNSVFAIPSLRSRRATSSLELYDGQTMAIAGLISDSVRETVDKFPGLGDIPILGLLFTSQEYLKDQTELVIFVTPRLAKPVAKDQIRLPTDNFVEPSELSFYLFGQMEGKAPRVKSEPMGTGDQGGLEGKFGHKL